MQKTHKIIINDIEYSFKQGQTILEAAKQNNIEIPTLCYLKNTSPTGKCEICLIEIKNQKNLVKACSYSAQDQMKIYTESKRVIESRQSKIKKLLAIGNHNCAISTTYSNSWTAFQLRVHKDDNKEELCPVWGDCRLQDLAYKYQVTGDDTKRTKVKYPIEDVNPFIVRDFSRCILCNRCVKACNEIQVNNAIAFGYQGDDAKIITPNDKALKDSDCVFCGECVQVCPVGALVEKDTRYKIRPWQTKKTRTTCTYCGVGCQIYLHSKDDKVVKVSGADFAPNYESLCVKGRFGFDFIDSSKRLTTPLIRKNNELKESSWEEALDYISNKLSSIIKEDSSDHIGILSSARVTNEENYIAQKFARAVLKTNNVDHCARL